MNDVNGLSLFLLPPYGDHWNPNIFLARVLIDSIPARKFNNGLHPFNTEFNENTGINLLVSPNLLQSSIRRPISSIRRPLEIDD